MLWFLYLGLGGTGPDPSEAKVLPDGVTVPLGKSQKTEVHGSSLLYNEYLFSGIASSRGKLMQIVPPSKGQIN